METPRVKVVKARKRLSVKQYEDDGNHNNIKRNDNDNDIDQMKNLCMECDIDMGECNPRQLCGKTVCLNAANDNNDDDDAGNQPPTKKKISIPLR